MTTALDRDLEKLKARAFDRANWAEDALRRYHAVIPKLTEAAALSLHALYQWMFVPPTLWPFNIQDVLVDCLMTLEKGKKLNARQQLVIEMLPEPPDESVCTAVADHEKQVHSGTYEKLVKTQVKFYQHAQETKTNPELRRQWARIKAVFDVEAYREHKGVIRRSMCVERNLRPSFEVNMRSPAEVFQAVFDAFCLRWNLFGMKYDHPLTFKLSVNLSAYGTMIHIPAYWSFDPKRDICWDAIAKLHRVRVPKRQGAALAEGLVERKQNAEKLPHLDAEAKRLGLKGEKKHEFLCAGLGWVPGTSPKRISRLRTEFIPRLTGRMTRSKFKL
ncbi:MAG: hypothetical protein WCO56_09155 [Verrucomicrobiota bacterium]